MTTETALQQLVTILTPLLMALVAWGTAELARWVRSHVKNAYLQGVLTRLDEAVATVVIELMHTEVRQLKDDTADGKLSAEDAQRLKDTAVKQIKAYLGKQAVNDLEKVFDPKAVEQMISSKIEVAVGESK